MNKFAAKKVSNMSSTIAQKHFPLGSKVRIADLDLNPYPILNELREHEPVSWVPELGMWFVTRRDDMLAVLKDVDTYTVESTSSPIRDTFGAHMLSTDGETQRKYKKQCTPPFTSVSVRDLFSEIIASKANSLIDSFPGDESVDLRSAFASSLSVHTVATALGFPEQDQDNIREWYDHFAASLANFSHDADVRLRGLQAAEEFRSHAFELIADFERLPNGSLLSALTTPGKEKLSKEEVVSNALIIMFGGIETTESMILNTLWALFSHPDQLELVLRDETLIPAAIEEALRWEPSVQSCTRYACRNALLRGVEITEGDVVQCMIGGANRDPEHFESPDEFNIGRANSSDHLSFGNGSHFCLGAHLARAEARIGIKLLFDRLPGLRMDEEQPSLPRGYEFRKPPTLYVKWDR